MRLPLYIEQVGSLYFDGMDGGQQPELKVLVREECRGRYRRIDRFTQLALLGAARCASGETLAPDTLLYIASGKGSAGNNIDMQRAIIAQRELPMPVQFINAVSNSVSFYVMQDLALSGQNLFVSREYHAFEAALSLAALDLEAQRAGAALLGMVDEITHPLSEQCERLGVAEDTALGEGSHWFLLKTGRTEQAKAAIRDNVFFTDQATLLCWLKEFSHDCLVFFAHGMDQHTRVCCLDSMKVNRHEYKRREALWDGLSAGAMASFLVSGKGQWLLTLSGDPDGRYHGIVTECFNTA